MAENADDDPFVGRPDELEPETPGEGGPSDEELRGFFPEFLRRTLTMGFTGLFLTEEAVRKMLGPSVPREWVSFVLNQSEKTRAELVDRLSREFGRVLSALDPVEVLRRLFDGQSVEVSAKIRFFLDQEQTNETKLQASWNKEPGQPPEQDS